MNSQEFIVDDYYKLYNEAAFCHFITDVSGNIVQLNNSFLDLINMDREVVLNKIKFQDLLSVGSKIYYETHYLPLLQLQGTVKEINFDLLRSDKSKVPVLINSVLYKSNENGLNYIKSTIFDITQRKQFEKELLLAKKNAEELSKKLKETNEELLTQNEIIQQQNQSLEKLNVIKDKFFSIVAHDIKGPLSELNSFVYLITEGIEDLSKTEIKSLGDDVKESVNNAIRLADNLLIWAQSQIKEFGVRPTELFLERIIFNIISSFAKAADKKQILLTYTIDFNSAVIADQDQLMFIIRNLVSNAIKFTSNNGFVKIRVYETDSGELKISVADNGIGMSQDSVNNIFSSNKKATLLGTLGEKGTGLGLILTKEFVKMNNGKIEVISEEFKGSTFIVTLKHMKFPN